MSKILFVYPNKEGYPIIPLGISVLAGVLKSAGHEVDLFDITFIMPERLDLKAREKTCVVLKVDMEKYWGTGDKLDINEELKKRILSFDPDLIAFSIVENNYGCAKRLLAVVREVTMTPIIVGGIFPTVASDYFIRDENVDLICIGEGEYALLELARRLDRGTDILDIPNLIVKKDGGIIRNRLSKFYDWQPLTFQNWEIFDERHLYKPFIGKIWRTGVFEMSRGCPHNCTYCVNRTYQELFKYLGRYRREKPVEYAIEEMEYMKNRYSLDLVFFDDENFLMMSRERFDEFCDKYEKRVGIPFFIQTRAETLLDEEKVKRLKEVNCITIGIGVESGSSRIRHEILKRFIPEEVYVKAFDNCNKYEIRNTAYVMMGLPFETEEDILLTAEFCKRLKATSVGLSIFAPYHGTRLREICIENSFAEDRYNEDISVNYTTMCKMPQLPKEKLEEIYYKFHELVYGTKEVRIAQ